MAHTYPSWLHPTKASSSRGPKARKSRTRTGDQDHNGIRRCLSRRSNTIERFDHEPIPRGGFCGHTTRFLDEPSDSTAAPSWDIIAELWPNAISGERLVTSKGGANGGSVGLLTERVPAGDRNPSRPATSAMTSEQNQVASSSTRPPLRSTASKRAPDESRSVSFCSAVCAFVHGIHSLLLLPSHDNNNWYFPSQGHDSDEDLMNYGISRGNWGKKKAKGSRWVRTGKLAAWGPGHEDWGVRVFLLTSLDVQILG
jgi:hypothetical protein